MSLVLESSLALSWFFEDERTPAADALLDRVAEGGAHVPTLWRLEIANGLHAAVRRQRLDVSFRDLALDRLARLPITVDPETDAHAWSTTLHLAARFDLTLYGAAYLELAQRRRLPLATLDQKLRPAASAAGTDVLGLPP